MEGTGEGSVGRHWRETGSKHQCEALCRREGSLQSWHPSGEHSPWTPGAQLPFLIIFPKHVLHSGIWTLGTMCWMLIRVTSI